MAAVVTSVANATGMLFRRILFTSAIFFATYNPYGYSWWHWINGDFQMPLVEHLSSLKALATVFLVIWYVILLRSAYRSTGVVGTSLVIFLVTGIVWVIYHEGIFPPDDDKIWQSTLLVAAGAVVGTGLTWSHLRAWISGQVDSHDVTY